jgi:replicative DNA helicase
MPDDIKLTGLPPQSLEAEQSVLGSMILDRDQIAIVLEILQDHHFYAQKHAEIYKTIIELYERNEPVDMVTLITLLEKKNMLEKIGGPAYLSTLVDSVPTPKSANAYAKIVEQKSMLRDLIKAGNEMTQWGYQEEGEVDEIVARSEKLLYDISKGRAFKDINPIKPILKEAFDQINKKYSDRGGVSGLPTGYRDLDNITSGFQPSDLIILAARPGMGKTSLALNIADHIAVERHRGVGIFTLEMAATQLATRMICSRSKVDAAALRGGFLVDEDWPKIMQALDQLTKAPIVIVDSPGVTPLEVRAKARRMQKEHNIEFIVIDYLQLMTMSGRRQDSRVQEISEITRQMKLLARELEVPVMVISQLSRAVEQRQNKHPQLSDLRESGSIEQDADLVMFLYRAEYYREQLGEGADEEDSTADREPKKAELIVAKHRNGPTGKLDLTFLNEYTKFEAYTTREPYS